MKYPPLRLHSSRPGFALILILGLLVLITGLCVGFLTRTGTERSASSEYRSSATARQLADSCVSLVQGQINLATTKGSNVAWASQPGMVRTFDTNGNLLLAYKLYSAQQMVSSTIGITNGKSEDEPPLSWPHDVAIWTDLNAPVNINGVRHFPILSPGTSAEGFSITSAPNATEYQPVPMPVRWLYVLQDGSMVAPSGTGKTATVPGATASTGTNPIVGRIAFWTDDDTCKININTASEGTYWDTPRANSDDDYNLEKYQPAQKEFQRYPGHPAMTCLSTVFPLLSANDIYKIVPRISGGGSQAGTAVATSALQLDSDRLYANVDELLFTNQRTDTGVLTEDQVEQSKFFLTAHSRAPETNLFNLPRIAAWPIYKMSDTGVTDLTRTSAFDRLIAFCSSTGTQGTTSWHPYIFQRENPSSVSNDIDLSRNNDLYRYLQYLTGHPIPGFGGDFLTKYGTDRDQILTEIFDYIRATNLQDSSQTGLIPFTPQPTGTFDVVALPSGYGWVAPSKKGDTLGFGRNYTISQLALVFICNAAPDDPTTGGKSYGSNNPLTNQVFASGEAPLSSGEKYIQAMILPELFSPLQGFVYMEPDLQMTISGLDSFSINGKQIFPLIPESNVFKGKSAVYEMNRVGGAASYRYFGFGKGSPQRGNLPSETQSGLALYPFIGTPVRIAVPSTGGAMAFSGGQITVKLYAGHTSPPVQSQLIQTLTINFPAGTFPVPEIVPDGINVTYPNGSQNQGGPTNSACNWWSFSRVGCIKPAITATSTNAGTAGRLAFIGNRVNSSGLNTTTSNSQYYTGVFLRPEYDTIRAMLPAHGDFRLVAASQNDTSFVPHHDYSNINQRMAASFTVGSGVSNGPLWKPSGSTAPTIFSDPNGKYISEATYNKSSTPNIPSTATGANSPEGTGDYDNGLACLLDGPYVNKPDEGDITFGSFLPYVQALKDANEYRNVGSVFFSPNRQIPSPGMFGSLPTGVKANVPWRTLLFRPQANHFGSNSPKDHLFMDLFWMPVVEPYAISDRFSTAGKINLNYQILPFTYIERSTGLRALFKSEKVAAVPTSRGIYYKGDTGSSTPGSGTGAYANDQYRFPIDAEQTLSQFKDRFNTSGIFKSASEICDLHIVPQTSPQTTVAQMADISGAGFWKAHALTGDNWRERIYTTLYGRLTTKSNTYTVHFCAQALRPTTRVPDSTWIENQDAVLAEYRGSTTIERFINPGAPVPDYAANPSSISAGTQTLDKLYKWRIISNKQFSP